MSIAVSAAALLLLTGDAGQAAPRPQTPAPATTQAAPRPAAPSADLTRSLNSGPPRPAEYLAPAPTADADEDDAAASPPARSTAPAAAPATSTPRPSTAAPTTGASPARPAATAPATTRPAAPTTTRPTTAPTAPSTTRPTTTAPATSAPATSAPATTTTPPRAIGSATAPPRATAPAPSTRPATSAPAAAAPPAPGVTVLDAVAIDALPFSVDLPSGFEIVTGRPGPDFRIYTIRRGDRSFVMIYAGPASQFPIYSGDVVEAGGRASVITNDDGQRRALEHLFQRTDAPREIHVWTMSLEGADRALAERIAQSVDVE